MSDTLTGINLIVGTVTAQIEVQTDVVTVTVGYQEVSPILKHVSGIAQIGAQCEVVIGPAEALTPPHTHAKDLHELVWVVIVLIVVIAIVAVAIEKTVVIAVVCSRVVVVVTHVGLLAEECTHTQCIGTLAAKPWVHVAHAIGLIVASIGLTADTERLTITLWEDSSADAILLEQIGHAEVTELQTNLSYHASLSVTQ